MKQVKTRQLATRQRIRLGLLFISMLLFPITLYYFSPALVLQGAAEGVVNGSMLVFGAMFVAALFVGRLWCGWACPAGGMQEFGAPINNRRTPGGRWNLIKWAIWIPWLSLILFLAIQAGGFHTVDPFFQLEGGLTLLQDGSGGGPPWFMIYYVIIALFMGLAVVAGRRGACHYVCWMAPFMILGRKIRNLVRWPALGLRADAEACIDCQRCSRDCPMSLDVNGLVHAPDMEHDECILCGTCVDVCPQDVIRYSFGGGR